MTEALNNIENAGQQRQKPPIRFGTDGIRAIANTELSPELAFCLGEAAVACFGKRIILGRDTRLSGVMLESMLVAGILSAGGDALCCGVIPTPALACLCRKHKADAAVVISASHNPPEYNGIKFFNHKGTKLSDTEQAALEDFINARPQDHELRRQKERKEGDKIGHLVKLNSAKEDYIEASISSVQKTLKALIDRDHNKAQHKIDLNKPFAGLKIALDCGHGASHYCSPEAFKRLGADLVCINTDYSGLDINVNCGSTNLAQLKELLLSQKADLGIAHDGDADRMLALDHKGNEIDGDQILNICASFLSEEQKRSCPVIVATLMSNMGLEKALQKQGLKLERTQVGDRYVLERMIELGAVLGGEQSGHLIFLEHNSTGDGLLSALQLTAAVVLSGKSLHELGQEMEKYPQVLINVEVENKELLSSSVELKAALKDHEERLGDKGRILLRASGTESLVRVMVEAQTEELAQEHAQALAKAVKNYLA